MKISKSTVFKRVTDVSAMLPFLGCKTYIPLIETIRFEDEDNYEYEI